MCHDIDWRKTPDSSTRVHWQSYPQSSSSKQRNGRTKWRIWPWEVFLFILPKVIVTCRKINDMGLPALLPFRMKACCGFLSPFAIHSLGRVWTANLGPNDKHANHYTTDATNVNISVKIEESACKWLFTSEQHNIQEHGLQGRSDRTCTTTNLVSLMLSLSSGRWWKQYAYLKRRSTSTYYTAVYPTRI
jgi:hypothetical protein